MRGGVEAVEVEVESKRGRGGKRGGRSSGRSRDFRAKKKARICIIFGELVEPH